MRALLQLAATETQRRLKEYFNHAVIGPKLLVVDEIGLTSNLPFTQWAGAFADAPMMTAALLDRLLHHAHIVQITGESYRLKDRKWVGFKSALTTGRRPA